MNSEAPVNAGHTFANTAEDLEERELWSEAVEAHLKAAEQFKIAMNDAHDTEATRTLRLLTANHIRKSNDLKRRVERLAKASQTHRSYQLLDNSSNNNSGLRHALPDRYQKNNSMLVSRIGNRGTSYLDEGYRHNGISESYALLSNDGEEDASDPFNKFLLAVEGLVDQLINPAVAFTSAPLNENDIPLPSEVPTIIYHDHEESFSNILESFYIVPTTSTQSKQTVKDVIPSIDYDKENQSLRNQIALLTRRMKTLEMSI